MTKNTIIVTDTEMQNNFDKYMDMVSTGYEIIITVEGKVAGKIVPVNSPITDSLTGILKNASTLDYDLEREKALKEKYMYSMNIKNILSTMSKEELIDAVIDLSDQGHFPIDVVLSKANYNFTLSELNERWEFLLNWVKSENERNQDVAAYALADCADDIFEATKKLEDTSEIIPLLKSMSEDLRNASECDGIGMEFDNDYVYMQVCEKIEKYIAEKE